MITFKNLAIQGFKSFKTDSLFHFPPGSGFYMLTGRNDLEPRLGPNATGKSSIWDALCWVLYGKTARGLRAGNIANWERADLTSVLVEFNKGKEEYALTRTWDPNSLTLQLGDGEPKPVLQEDVDELIGVDYSGFLYTVLMGQFNDFFFDLGPTEKLLVFSEALGLEYWVGKAKLCTEKAGHWEAKITEWEREKEGLKEAVKVLWEELTDARKAMEQFEKERRDVMATLLNSLKEKKGETSKRAEEHETAFKDLFRCRDAMNKGWDMVHEARTKVGDINNKLAKEEAVFDTCERDLANYDKEMERVKKLEGQCPCCKRPILKSHVLSALEDIKLHRGIVEAEQAHSEARLKKDEKLKRKIKVSVQKSEEAYKVLQEKYHEADRKAYKAKDAMEQADRDYLHAKGERDKWKNKINPHKGRMLRLRDQRRAKKAKLAGLTEAIELAAKKLDGYRYWAKTFKDVRLWIVQEALIELEVEVNNCLPALGLEGWSVTFEVEKETKAGNVSRGFNVLIESPGSPKAVPWEAWSGGETQRLRIAGSRGLARLVCGRRGFESNVEVWDEPTAHLSEAGIQDLLLYFEGQAKASGKQLWLVDHRSLSYGGFTGITVVVKDDFGSRVLGSKGARKLIGDQQD